MWVWHNCLSLTTGFSCTPSSWVDLGEYVGTAALAFAVILGFWAGFYWVADWLSGR